MKRQAALLMAAVVAISTGASAQRQPPPAPEQGNAQAQRRKVALREALQLAAKQGPDIAASRAQAAVVHAGVEKAWTAWQPDISATGTFDHTSAPQELNFAGLASGLAPFLHSASPITGPTPSEIAAAPNFTIVAANSRFATLQIVQPLLTPQGLFLPGIANAASEAAARAADESREQVLLAVARTYLNLQALEGLLNAAREAEQVALRREQDARAQISAGTAVELALLRAQTETANARVQIANFEGNNQSLWPLLEALTGERVEPLPFGAPQEIPEVPASEAEPWENSYAVKSAAAAVIAAERSTRLDRFAWIPSVSASARGNYNSNGGFAGTSTTYDLILNVNVPIYDRGQRYAQLHEDQARLQEAQAQLASARARARATWDGAKGNLSSAQVALRQANIQAELAARTQQQVDASYRAGVATSLDLSDADQRKFLAQSGAAQARTEVEVRKAELAVAAGALYRISQQ